MTKRWLSTFLLATPISLSFSGTFDEDSAQFGNISPYAGIGATYSYQVSFNPDDFTPGTPYSDSYWGSDHQTFWGQASWSGLIGSTPFAWTGPTSAYVQDGFTGTGGAHLDALNLQVSEAIPLGASGGDFAHLYAHVQGSQATFSGTDLSNFGSMSALASTGSAYAQFESYTADGSFQGHGFDFNSLSSIHASVPEPTLVSILSSL